MPFEVWKPLQLQRHTSETATSMAKTDTRTPPAGGSKGGTTIVRADSACFRDLVQRLTGPPPTLAQTLTNPLRPKPLQKLHERRKYKQTSIEIEKSGPFQFRTTTPFYFGPCYPQSPSSVILFSPATSLQPSPISSPGTRTKRPILEVNHGEEEKAIKEKRFYLHQSPASKARTAQPEPELLTLFPLTSPTAK